jgi:uracil-DNA glycosylase family 4
MNQHSREKIEGFFEWYDDLYGNNYFVDRDKISPHRPQRESAHPSPLEQFKSEIENCTRCSLHKTRTNFVFGVGNEDAEIFFVGEAPGKYEDLQGEPFVGQAGQLLNKMLAHIHLKRSDVYIANILKSRPPNNRDPLPEEVEQCIPYLHRQIEIIKPKLLVALGRIAAQNLLGTNQALSKLRGHVWKYKGTPLIVTYHPAAILREESLQDAALEDFHFISKTTKN